MGPYPPPYGGVQIHLMALCQFLRQRNVPCAVINLTRFRRRYADNVYYPKGAMQVLYLLSRIRYNIVHLQIGGSLNLRLLMLCLICSVIPGVKTVLTFHSGGYPSSRKGRAAHPWTVCGIVLRRIDRLIAVNEDIKSLFLRYGVELSRIRVMRPDAVSFEAPAEVLPDPIRQFYLDHAPILVSVGGLEPEYQIPLQIEVLGEVRKQFPKAGLVVIGSGSLEMELRAMVLSKSYAEHILLCNDVPHSIVLRAIADCDVVLRTTLYDGDSIAVREALYFRVPVIATDNEMRPAGVTLVPLTDVKALSNAITTVCASVSLNADKITPNNQSMEGILKLYQELTAE